MAQLRYTNYKDDKSSFNNNIKDIGIVPHGLYRGFDYDATSSGTTLVLSHTVNGYSITEIDGSVTSDLGVVRTRQGVMVVEDAAVSITGLTDNSLESDPRIDLIVLEHTYVETIGGTAAGYTQIIGTPGSSPVAPALTDDTIQVILGELYWPAGAASTDDVGVVYTKAPAPFFVDSDIFVTKAGVQEITGRKRILHQIGDIATATLDLVSGSIYNIKATTDSNMYSIANVGPNYINVIGVDVPFSGDTNYFKVYTLQKLRIVGGGSGAIVVPNSVMHIEAGETFELWDVSGQFGYSSNTYLVTKGNAVLKNSPNKLFAAMIGNKGTGTYGTNLVTIPTTGDYIEVATNFTTIDTDGGILYFSSTDSLWDGVNTVTKAGRQLVVKITDSSGFVNGLQLRNTGTSTSTYKKIEFADGGGIRRVGNGASAVYLKLLEETDKFIVLEYWVNEQWIASGMTPDGVSPVQYSRQGNTVFIRGVSYDAAPISVTTSVLLFTLPLGYNPSVPFKYITAATYSGSLTQAIIEIDGSGNVRLRGDLAVASNSGVWLTISFSTH